MILGGSWWFLVVLGGSFWFLVVHEGLVSLDGFLLFLVVLCGSW